jgi:hypothetical protein
MEDSQKSMGKNMIDIWAESSTDYWSKLMGLNGNNGNGTMKHAQNTLKSCMSIWKSFATLMTDPATLATLPKAAGEIPGICMDMQQREMERLLRYQSRWFDKTGHYEKLSRLMCMKAFS